MANLKMEKSLSTSRQYTVNNVEEPKLALFFLNIPSEKSQQVLR